MTSSLLAHVEMAPKDPILGVTETYNADTNPKKVNLGVGVYYDDNGKVPLLQAIRTAEIQMAETALPRNYLPIDGMPAYNKAVKEVIFGADSEAVKSNRIVTVQTLGGTGGLKIGADLAKRLYPESEAWISDPSWENHRALLEFAGFKVNAYPYYDAATHGLKFNDMLSCMDQMAPGSLVLLHACCHNPTGVDLSAAQWQEVIEMVKKKNLLPFLDMAYQGFSEGLNEDAHAVRAFTEACPAVLVSSSFSKSMSLYGERVGAFSVVTASAEEAARLLSQVKRVIRTNYSNPSTHGGMAVTKVLTTPELRTQWEQELTQMRERIKTMRRSLVEKIRSHRADFDFNYVANQRGMFSYSGLTKEHVTKLREEFSIYALDSGRICVAALNSTNIDYVSEAIAKVIVR
jgi:aromatic-amino-acid transaminase